MLSWVKRMKEGDNKRGDSRAPIREWGSEWDKHWQELLDEGLEDVPLHEMFRCSTRWLRNVKAEGDKMQDKLEAIKKWMKGEWSNMNAFWQLDITTHEHPRWKLKEILGVTDNK